MLEAMANCSADKVPGLDGLPYELYKIIPYLFGHLLANIFMNWKQNDFIPRSVHQSVVTLVGKDLNK